VTPNVLKMSSIKGQGHSVKTSSDRQVIALFNEIGVAEYNSDQCEKTFQFITQCKGDISRAFKTAKIIVFNPMMCKKSRCALTRGASMLTICKL